MDIMAILRNFLNAFKFVKLTIAQQGQGYVFPMVGDHYYLGHPAVKVEASSSVSGWRFSHWEGDLTGSKNPDVVKMSVNKIVTAVFVQDTYQVNSAVSPAEGGTVTRDNPGPYGYGSLVSLTAVPSSGYKFLNWSGSVNSVVPTINLIVNGNINVVATFDKVTYTLTVSVEGNGTVAKNPDKSTYNAGEQVQLTATPGVGSHFDHWVDNGVTKTENPTTTTVG